MNMKEYLYTNKPYIIAETAYSFEGDKQYLLKQTEVLNNNVDGVKFHLLLNIDEYMIAKHPVYNLAKNWILSSNDWKEIFVSAKSNNLDVIALVDDISSVNFCKNNNELVDAIEIHAACVNDLELFQRVIDFSIDYDKVLIIGISGFEIQELLDITEYLKERKAENILMMYGFQNFPTKVSDINLSKITILEKMLNCKIGYADHTEYSDYTKDILIYTSYALGANFQEIHFVLNEGIERTDFVTGIGIKKMCKIKETLSSCYHSIGDPDFRLNNGEKKYLNFRKVPIYNSDFKSGDILTKLSVSYKRVETPSKQHKFMELNSYYGSILNKDVKKDNEVIITDFRIEKDD